VTDVFDAKFTQIIGEKSGDEFGASVAAGDFDHDGFMDIAVGARGDVVGQGMSRAWPISTADHPLASRPLPA
jgi:hypothetical protein